MENYIKIILIGFFTAACGGRSIYTDGTEDDFGSAGRDSISPVPSTGGSAGKSSSFTGGSSSMAGSSGTGGSSAGENGTAGSGSGGTDSACQFILRLADSTPSTAIVTPPAPEEKLGYRSFTHYTIENLGNRDVLLTKAHVVQVGNVFDFQNIYFGDADASGIGAVVGISTGLNGETDTEISLEFKDGRGLTIPARQTHTLVLSGIMAEPVPSSTPGGQLPRSGHRPALMLSDVTTSDGAMCKPEFHEPPLMVLYKTQPVLSMEELPATTLANGVMPLFSWIISSDGPELAWNTLSFNIQKSGGVKLSDFRLRRAYDDVEIDRYKILWTNGTTDFRFDPMDESVTTAQFGIIFPPGNEERVDGAAVYTLYATVSGAGTTGRFVSLQVGGGSDEFPNQGWLVPTKFPMLDTDFVNDGDADESPPFVWSDLSEDPHSDAFGVNGGSRDWINSWGLSLEDFRKGTTISN